MEIMSTTSQPLVSIVVITYNSAKYVLETLESAKAQTYQNIELIISDDCSSDDTVEICREWVMNNKNRFVRSEFITTAVNSGISANCNRGAKMAVGEWIKFIAGDDILAPICIEEFIGFTKSFPNANIIFSQQQSFTEEKGERTLLIINPQMHIYNKEFYSGNSSVKTQYNYLLERKVSVAGPSYIVKMKLLQSINYFDEKYKLLEDYPMYMRVLEQGNYFYFFDKVTVYYRSHKKSISSHGSKEKIYPDFFRDWYAFLMDYNFKRINIIYKIDLLIEVFIFKVVLLMGNHGRIAMMLWANSRKLLPSRYLSFLRIIK